MKPVKFYLTAYEVNRTYGGPEEGGWSYDQLTVIASIQTKGKPTILGNDYSLKPIKSDKKAKAFLAEWDHEDRSSIVVYSEKRKGQNSVGYQHYC